MMKNLSSLAALAVLVPSLAQAASLPDRTSLSGGIPRPSGVDAAPMDFDQGFSLESVKTFLHEEGGAAVPAVKMLSAGSQTATKDCAPVTFNYGDEAVSQPKLLQSHVYQEVCKEYYGEKFCWNEPVGVWRKNVTVALKGSRSMLPWEQDVFVACLQGEKLSVETVKASHEYTLSQKASQDAIAVEAAATGKLRTQPDPSGITAESLANAPDSSFTLTLKDKWAQYYKGEKTVVRVTLKKEVPHWMDPVVIKKEFAFTPADAYVIAFTAFAQEFRQPLETGSRYYVEWDFKREGKVSASSTQAGGETPRVEYTSAR